MLARACQLARVGENLSVRKFKCEVVEQKPTRPSLNSPSHGLQPCETLTWLRRARNAQARYRFCIRQTWHEFPPPLGMEGAESAVYEHKLLRMVFVRPGFSCEIHLQAQAQILDCAISSVCHINFPNIIYIYICKDVFVPSLTK